MKPLRVEIQLPIKLMFWMGLIFGAVCGVGCAASGVWLGAMMFLAIAGMSNLALEELGSIEADSQGVWMTTRSGRYEIKWSEVTKIESTLGADNINSHNIVLHAPNKKIVISGPSAWRKDGRDEMLRFINEQAQAWSIPCEQTVMAHFQVSRNTKGALPKRPQPPLSL